MFDNRGSSPPYFLIMLYFLPLWGVVVLGCGYFALLLIIAQLAPFVELALSLYLSILVSWICVRELSRFYSGASGEPSGGPSRWTQVWGMALFLLLYNDFLLLATVLGAKYFEADAEFGSWIELSPSFYLMQAIGAIFALEPYGLPAILTAVAIKAMLLPLVFLRQRGLRCADPHPVEPAFLSYFEKQAFRDLYASLATCLREIPRRILAVAVSIRQYLLSGRKAWFLWPLGLVAFLALVPPLLFATIFLASIFVLYGLGVVLLQLFNRYLALLLFLAERLVMKIRAGYAKCPHRACHQPLPLPIMTCACGAEHRRLLPGRTGILFRYCRCGRKLPTLFLLGKGNLPSRCPKCTGELPDRIFGANIHLPIYGGPDAGKTCLMAASVAQLAGGGIPEIETGWLRERDRLDFEQQWAAIPQGGALPRKTTEQLPNAYLMSLQREEGLAASLYLYDPAGEAFTSGDKLSAHRFMSYYSGLLLIVDPLAFPEVETQVRRATGAARAGAGARLRPREVFDRLVQQLEGLDRLDRSATQNQPIAVIVTKCDLEPLDRELAPAASTAGVLSRQAGEEGSSRVREWLAQQDGALVHGIEGRFSKVRYFATAAAPVGPAPRPGRESVLAPLSWILSWQPVLQRPLLTRWSWVCLETAAFGGVALLALAPPAVVLAYGVGWL